MIFLLIRAQLLVGVQDFVIGAVADGMDGHGEPRLRSFAPVLKKFLAIHVKDASVILFAEVRLEHRSGMWTQRAVHERFDRANPQPVIAEACTETNVIYLIEQLYRHIFEHTQFELALRMKLLQRHKRIAPVKIVDTG